MRRKYEGIPAWLSQLARQLELWVGEELDSNPPYLEVSFGQPPTNAVPAAGERLSRNAFYADALFLRSVTKSFWVAVDVGKPSGQIADASVSVVVVPRTRLISLQAIDWSLRWGEPETIRLKLSYDGVESSFCVSHVEESVDTVAWIGGDGLRLFRTLRDDLWSPPHGVAVLRFG